MPPRLAAAAHFDPGRRWRPNHPAGQRQDHAPADPCSELHIHRDGHRDLATDAERPVPVVKAFLTAETEIAPKLLMTRHAGRAFGGTRRRSRHARALGRRGDSARSASALREAATCPRTH
jgi:hypothetical protein